MTGLSLVFILISFSILYVLQLMFNKFFLKLIVITYLFLISSGVYFSFDSYKGWPSKDKIEEGMLVISMTVEPSEHDKGAIYLWVVPNDKELTFVEKFLTYNFGMVAPRSYYIPYSKKAASEFAEANEKIKQGYIVMIEGEKSEEGGEGEGNQQREGEGRKQSNGEQENYDVPSLDIISPDTLMRKGTK
jgi:hypothetical protein